MHRIMAVLVIWFAVLGCSGNKRGGKAELASDRPSVARCSSTVACPTGQYCHETFGTGICSEQCPTTGARCQPTEVAYGTGSACVCIPAAGPGSPCTTSSDCGGGYDCLSFMGVWAQNPPGGVCVPTAAPHCDGGTACTAGQCVQIAGSTGGAGVCTQTCPTAPCRFDEVAVGAGAACTCQKRDPAGKACGSCGWLAAIGSEPVRECKSIAGRPPICMQGGVCKPSDVCDNTIDDDCDGADRKSAPEICGNGTDEDCNGSDLVCPVVPCTPQRWVRDNDGDGHGNPSDVRTECARPAGYIAANLADDCDDNNPRKFPGNSEACGDGIDNNCNALCEENCLNEFWQMALCPGKTDYRNCADIMLTTDKNEGGNPSNPNPGILLYTYKQHIPGVTNPNPLLRCYVNGVHFTTIGANNCSNIEGSFGFIMTSFTPGGKTLVDCYGQIPGQQVEMVQVSTSPTPTKCSGEFRPGQQWKRFGDFGYQPRISGSYTTPGFPLHSCWGQ
jgi:hypothetical protein